MTYTPLTGPGRIAQFVWGSRNQSTFAMDYPIAVDNAKFWRQLRPGSERAMVANVADSWVLGRDFYSAFSVRWVDYTQWSGHCGFQAFLDFAMSGKAFLFVPDAVNAPLYMLPGCLMVTPFESVTPYLEVNGAQAIDVVIRNPTYDLGLAWR